MKTIIGKIFKVTGWKALIKVSNPYILKKVSLNSFSLTHVSIGSLLGTKLVDNRILVLTIGEIFDDNDDVIITCTYSGNFDENTNKFTFGTNAYPILGEDVFTLETSLLNKIFSIGSQKNFIGTYAYDEKVNVYYNPNVIFGKHLGVFGNTGSGKTCTVVSLIQNYIRNNPEKNIKFLILDVNGEYTSAFSSDEAELISLNKLKLHHSILSKPEYGKLFRAAEGVQYPALIDSIEKGGESLKITKLPSLLRERIKKNASASDMRSTTFNENALNGYLRTLFTRIDSIIADEQLMNIIDDDKNINTLDEIAKSKKKIFILDLQISYDTLDIVLFLLFKKIYSDKAITKSTLWQKTHFVLVLEEAHRYINHNIQETKLGSYFIDKLTREGRKFGIGLVISSQVPSLLSYEIVSQCNSVIMHKITSKHDLEFLKGVMRVNNDSFYLQMNSLEKQYAIVCGEGFQNDALVRICNADPLPNSNDPTIGEIDK